MSVPLLETRDLKEYVDGTHCIACHLFGGKA